MLFACADHALVPPNPMPEEQTDQYVPVVLNPKADILFVVDNSGSMKEEQENLARNFPAFIDLLRSVPGGLPDLHIGVVTTDLGAGTLDASGCRPGGQRGAFQGWDKGCGLAEQSRFIVAANGEHERNYQGDLAEVFACMARVGISGCGYEHQLAAASRALSADRTPENAGFLRDDAFLQIVLITDEDDCSADAGSDLFTREFPGEETSYRCARAGHICQGQQPPDADFSAPLDQCRPMDNGALSTVQTFVDQILALKKDPTRILVSGIFGWPNGEPGVYRVGKQLNETTHQPGGWDYLPTCKSANGSATAALRVKQFVDAFGERGSFASICSDSFRPVLENIAQRLIKTFPSACVAAPLVDIKSDPGLQADCQVSESAPARGGYDTTYLSACEAGKPGACWKLQPKASCDASGFEVVIDRKGQPVPAESLVAIKCRTCIHADDERCRR
ncbi:MAG TPA: hypothetical protein VN914_02085 [Polyangia bacterium]|nr:hypothetical protein [Polyangia bacterium]